MLSPTIGQPIAAQCTRNWCVRPVSGSSASQVKCRGWLIRLSRLARSALSPAYPVEDGRKRPFSGGEGERGLILASALASCPLPNPPPQAGEGTERACPLLPNTFHVVDDSRPLGSGFIHQPRLSSSLPSGRSMRPRSASGPPSTNAQ